MHEVAVNADGVGMAGIGFALRKMAREDSLSSAFQALVLSSLVASGPWIITVAGLGLLRFMVTTRGANAELEAFQAIMTYNFQFSPIIVAPVAMLVTRFVADTIYQRRISDLGGAVAGGLVLTVAFVVPAGMVLHAAFGRTYGATFFWATAHFVLTALTWYVSALCSMLRTYRYVAAAFGAGAATAGLLPETFPALMTIDGLLLSVSAGATVTVAMLAGKLLTVFDQEVTDTFAFLSAGRAYPELALGALCFTGAIWVDKWIMWAAPEATVSALGYAMYPGYETVMFLASLSAVPVLGLFVLSMETGFYETSRAYHQSILNHADIDAIEEHRRALVSASITAMRNFTILQGGVTLLSIFAAPQLLSMLGLPFSLLGMFRMAVVGTFFFLIVLFTTIFLSYFDARRSNLSIQALYLVLNLLLGIATLYAGFPYYGFGFLVANVLSAAVSLILFARILDDLPYFTFVLGNARRVGVNTAH